MAGTPRPGLLQPSADPQEPWMHLDLAYIDPGSGSLIIQAVIATIVAIPFFFRHQIARVTQRFRGQPDSTETVQTPDGPDTEA